MRKITLSHRIRYYFDNIMARGTIALIGWLFICSAALVVIVSAIVSLLRIGPQVNGQPISYWKIAWLSLMRTLDPGTMGGDEGHWLFLFAMLSVTLGGIFIVSSLIGIITSSLDRILDELRKGRSLVLEEDHTVILGWSPQIFQVISELVIANQSRRKASIAILANRDKVEMEDAIKAKAGNTFNTRIVCRSGNPIDIADLEIVSPHTARSIIVLPPDDVDPDSRVIKTALAITNNPDRRPEPYHIVAAVQNPKNLCVIKMVAGDELEPLLVDDLLARIIAQTSRQSGLSVVYTDLLNFEGDEIYFQEEPSLAGKTFGEALLAYESSTVLGLHRLNGGVQLNPPMDTHIQAGDQIIAISEDDDTIRLSGLIQFPIVDDALNDVYTPLPPKPERALILGWNRSGCNVVSELDHYMPLQSQVDVVAMGLEDVSELECQKANLQRVAVTSREGDTTDRSILDWLDIPSYDQVIVLSYSDSLSPEEADARTLVTLLHLRDIGLKHKETFTIVSEMLDIHNRELAEVTKADDFIVSGQLIGLMLAQISENKALSAVFEDLFDPEGSEIYIKPISNYVKPGKTVNFYTLVEAARRRGEVAIGYRLLDQAGDPRFSYGIRLNPLKSEKVVFHENDRLIVLAQE